MEYLLLALTVGLPLIKFLLFPARTMGRGGSWTIIGAVMIVGWMMVLWFAVQSFSDVAGDFGAAQASNSTDATPPQPALPDLDQLAKML